MTTKRPVHILMEGKKGLALMVELSSEFCAHRSAGSVNPADHTDGWKRGEPIFVSSSFAGPQTAQLVDEIRRSATGPVRPIPDTDLDVRIIAAHIAQCLRTDTPVHFA